MKHISLSEARLAIPKVLSNHESAVILSKNTPIGVVIPFEEHESMQVINSLVNRRVFEMALQSHLKTMAGDLSETHEMTEAFDGLVDQLKQQ